jgi:hypothetical protein
LAVTSGDSGLIQFLLGDRKAVLVDDIVLCGGCYKGYNCSNRGTRHVRVYALLVRWNGTKSFISRSERRDPALAHPLLQGLFPKNSPNRLTAEPV